MSMPSRRSVFYCSTKAIPAFILLTLCALLTAPISPAAELSSTNYRVKAGVISSGGGTVGSGSYTTMYTVGQAVDNEVGTSSHYLMYPGFWNVLTPMYSAVEFPWELFLPAMKDR